MPKFRLFAVAVPALALAACGDRTTSSLAGPPNEISVASARGAILAKSLCAQCHGEDLNGRSNDYQTCPSLRDLRKYSLEEFEALLTAGLTKDGDVATAMVLASEQLGPDDRSAIYDYLAFLPAQ